MNLLRIFFGLTIAAGFAACSWDKSEKQPEEKKVTEIKLPQPFRFHKMVEVKPGLTFDVLSWGRGAEFIGGLLILRSDSVHTRYRSVTDELEGRLIDAWNMDMDSDGHPEIFVQAFSGDEGRPSLNLLVYEFNSSGSAQKLHFPDLSSGTKRHYRGRDSLYVKDGSLMRQFPLFEEADTAGVKLSGKKLLEYRLRGNSFSVKEIEE